MMNSQPIRWMNEEDTKRFLEKIKSGTGNTRREGIGTQPAPAAPQAFPGSETKKVDTSINLGGL